MDEDTPVLDTIADMTASSLENSNLNNRELMLTRLAALAAVDAPAASYLLNFGASVDAGLTIEDVQGVLSAVAPIIGAPRTLDAAIRIRRSLGVVIAVMEAEIDAQMEAAGY